MQNTRLPKYRPLSTPLKAAYLPVTSYNFSKCIFLYLLNIRNLSYVNFSTAYFALSSELRLSRR